MIINVPCGSSSLVCAPIKGGNVNKNIASIILFRPAELKRGCNIIFFVGVESISFIGCQIYPTATLSI